MGRKCCCRDQCKNFCCVSDNGLGECCLNNGMIPEEAQEHNFSKAEFTVSGFQDWNYDKTYSGDFADMHMFLNDYTGFNFTNATNPNVNDRIISKGNASINCKISILGLSQLNNTYIFNKDPQSCSFLGSNQFLGEITMSHILEITNISGDMYTFWDMPRGVLGCNQQGCNLVQIPYRSRAYRANIPNSWIGSIGTILKFDVYLNSTVIPYGCSGRNLTTDNYMPFNFVFQLKETEIVQTGIFSDIYKQVLDYVVEPRCFNRNQLGCPTVECSYSSYPIYNDCKNPFFINDKIDQNGVGRIKKTNHIFKETSLPPNNFCFNWLQGISYHDNISFHPFGSNDRLINFINLPYVDSRSGYSNFNPDGCCTHLFSLNNNEPCWDLAYYCNFVNDRYNPCYNWDDATKSLNIEYKANQDGKNLKFAQFENNINFNQFILSRFYLDSTNNFPINPTNYQKIRSCASLCLQSTNLDSGTGVFSTTFNASIGQRLLSYIFNSSLLYSKNFITEGVSDNPLVNIGNLNLNVPEIVIDGISSWGISEIITEQKFAGRTDLYVPPDSYYFGFTKNSIPQVSWSKIDNITSQIRAKEIKKNFPVFVLPPPLDIKIGAKYD